MERILKFRAWDRDLKGWIAEKFWVSDGIVWIRRGDMLVQLETELMQFTNLKDKNGTQIFEGDIVKISKDDYYDERKGQVIFEKGTFCLKDVEIWNDGSFRWSSLERLSDEDMEVIGDVYSTPELLT